MLCMFSTIKQCIFFCSHALQEHVLRWIKPPTTSPVVGALIDLTRGKAELLTENALLRHQLLILHRQVKRPVYQKKDRLLLVLLVRMVRTWNEVLFLVQPETLLRGPRELFRLFPEAQIQDTCEEAEALARDNYVDQGKGSKQPTLGSPEYSSVSVASYLNPDIRRSQTDHPEVSENDSPKTTKRTDVENILA